jgi:glycosyltransferase involved in cell wall biosynthesis
VVCHNTFDLTWKPLVTGATALAVVNSQWMRGEAEEHFHGRTRRPGRMLVVRPPVRAADYRTTRGDHITLINCNRDKGVGVFAALARANPDRRFLAVIGGHGPQEPPDLPNVTVIEHTDGRRMREDVYARTRLLLMPSVYESWGRVGVEAMSSGIPVIAHPTPGLAESLGEAGVFCDRADLPSWQAAIEDLDDPATYGQASKLATTRADTLDPGAELGQWCTAVEEVAAGARPATR